MAKKKEGEYIRTKPVKDQLVVEKSGRNGKGVKCKSTDTKKVRRVIEIVTFLQEDVSSWRPSVVDGVEH